MPQFGLFDYQKQLTLLEKAGDHLIALNKMIDWEQFRSLIEPFAKRSFRSNSALCSKFYPRNINHMPVVKFLAWFDIERKS